MGWAKDFAYSGPGDVFREHAALSGVAASLGGDFDISGLAAISDTEYMALSPTRWPVSKDRMGGRFFAAGGFFTPDKRARMIAVTPKLLANPVTSKWPFRLNTGRVRDHWHTMTRTGRSPRLNHHIAEPYVEIRPSDAADLNLRPADLARITSDYGEAVVRVLIADSVRRGDVFVPMHWTAQLSSAGRIGALAAAAVDPISGQPELKAATCAIRPYAAK